MSEIDPLPEKSKREKTSRQDEDRAEKYAWRVRLVDRMQCMDSFETVQFVASGDSGEAIRHLKTLKPWKDFEKENNSVAVYSLECLGPVSE